MTTWYLRISDIWLSVHNISDPSTNATCTRRSSQYTQESYRKTICDGGTSVISMATLIIFLPGTHFSKSNGKQTAKDIGIGSAVETELKPTEEIV